MPIPPSSLTPPNLAPRIPPIFRRPQLPCCTSWNTLRRQPVTVHVFRAREFPLPQSRKSCPLDELCSDDARSPRKSFLLSAASALPSPFARTPGPVPTWARRELVSVCFL